jgi:hypothetical protein
MMEAETAAAAAAIRRGWSTGKSSRPRICWCVRYRQRPALPHVGAGATVGTGAGRAGAPPLPPVAESAGGDAGGDWSELKFNCLNINLNGLN